MFNIFFLVFIAIIFAILVAVFITRQPTPNNEPLVPPEEGFYRDSGANLSMQDLKKVAETLCQKNGLILKNEIKVDENEIYWITESNNSFFFGNYILCLFEVTPKQPFATLAKLLEFKDFVKSATSTKGFFFTTGYFTKDAYQPLEGPKVALFNKPMVLEELQKTVM